MSELSQIEAEGVTYDLRDDGAVRQNQGTENAGKSLVIGSDGMVVPVNGAEAFSVTLTAAGWSEKVQTVTDSRFQTEGAAYTVAPAAASFAEYGKAAVYAEDVTEAGKMTFHCETVPTETLTVNILKQGATGT